MIKQRLSRNGTLFQLVEGRTMTANVLTKGKEQGDVELFRNQYQIRANSEMLEKRRQARERKMLRHQRATRTSILRFTYIVGCVKIRLDSRHQPSNCAGIPLVIPTEFSQGDVQCLLEQPSSVSLVAALLGHTTTLNFKI